jgi:probable RNA-binding protein EIF1AD
MSGLGRRTHYRKHLTDAVLNDFPEPAQNERIAKVVSTRGSNQFDLIVAPKDPSSEIEPTPQLAILPTKFRKLVWLKRNDYVICSCVEEEDDNKTTADGIKHMIEHILYKEQIKHLKEKGFWPKDKLFVDREDMKSSDYETDVTNQTQQRNDVCGSDEESEYSESDDDGIIYNDEQDDTYYCNMNRIAKVKIEDSSDEDSEED